MSYLIKNAHLVSPDIELFGAAVELEDGLVKKIYPSGKRLPNGRKEYNAAGKLVVPGFIDAHCHGGMGYEVTSDNSQAVGVIAEAKLREGVTSFCPSLKGRPCQTTAHYHL